MELHRMQLSVKHLIELGILISNNYSLSKRIMIITRDHLTIFIAT